MQHLPMIMVNGRRYLNLITAAPRLNLSVAQASRVIRKNGWHTQEYRSVVSGRVTHFYVRESDIEAWLKQQAERPTDPRVIKVRLKQYYEALEHRPSTTNELRVLFRQATGLEASMTAAREVMANKRPWTKNVVKWMEANPRMRELPVARMLMEAEKHFRATFGKDQIKFARKRYDALHRAIWAKENGAVILSEYAESTGIPYFKVYRLVRTGKLPAERKFCAWWIVEKEKAGTP